MAACRILTQIRYTLCSAGPGASVSSAESQPAVLVPMPHRIVIFTDLDGTLLDHTSYSFEEARSALGLAHAKNAAVVFSSSKTRAEIEVIREQTQVSTPFVVENGGAVYVPTGYFHFDIPESLERDPYQVLELGTPYPTLVNALKKVESRLGVGLRGFYQMTVAEIAADCGLSLEEAGRAKQREYDEPFILEDPRGEIVEQLREQAAHLGLRVTQGGRYFHLLGGNDKGRGVQILSEIFRKADGTVVTVALGDSLNDLPMLQAVDHPFLVRKADGRYDDEVLRAFPGVRLANGVGPAGWNAAVTEMLTGGL